MQKTPTTTKFYKVIDDLAWWERNYDVTPDKLYIIEFSDYRNCSIKTEDGEYIKQSDGCDDDVKDLYKGNVSVWSGDIIMREFEISHQKFNDKLDNLLGEE